MKALERLLFVDEVCAVLPEKNKRKRRTHSRRTEMSWGVRLCWCATAEGKANPHDKLLLPEDPKHKQQANSDRGAYRLSPSHVSQDRLMNRTDCLCVRGKGSRGAMEADELKYLVL